MIKFPYKRIISYGCSITAGSELGDASVFGMTDEQLEEYVRTNKLTGGGTHQLLSSLNVPIKQTYEKLLTLNFTLSWPNYIAKHFSIPLHNRSYPGTSLAHATNNILNDLHSSNISEDDLVLVGITSPSRWFQFDETGETMGGVVGYPWHNTTIEYQTQLEENFFNDYNLIYNYCKEIAFISNLSDTLNGQIKLCWTHHNIEHLRYVFKDDLKEKKFQEFFDFCVGIMPIHNFIDSNLVLGDKMPRESRYWHPFGHPKIELHKQFANSLIEKLEEMYSD